MSHDVYAKLRYTAYDSAYTDCICLYFSLFGVFMHFNIGL